MMLLLDPHRTADTLPETDDSSSRGTDIDLLECDDPQAWAEQTGVTPLLALASLLGLTDAC
jgi:hypothetical protein